MDESDVNGIIDKNVNLNDEPIPSTSTQFIQMPLPQLVVNISELNTDVLNLYDLKKYRKWQKNKRQDSNKRKISLEEISRKVRIMEKKLKRLNSIEQENKALRLKLEENRKSQKQKSREIELEYSLEQKNMIIRNLQQNYEALKNENVNLQNTKTDQIRNLEQSYEALKKENENLQNTKTDQQDSVNLYVRELENSNRILQNKNESLCSENMEIDSMLEASKNLMNEYQIEINNLKAGQIPLESELKTTKSEMELIKAERESLQNREDRMLSLLERFDRKLREKSRKPSETFEDYLKRKAAEINSNQPRNITLQVTQSQNNNKRRKIETNGEIKDETPSKENDSEIKDEIPSKETNNISQRQTRNISSQVTQPSLEENNDNSQRQARNISSQVKQPTVEDATNVSSLRSTRKISSRASQPIAEEAKSDNSQRQTRKISSRASQPTEEARNIPSKVTQPPNEEGILSKFSEMQKNGSRKSCPIFDQGDILWFLAIQGRGKQKFSSVKEADLNQLNKNESLVMNLYIAVDKTIEANHKYTECSPFGATEKQNIKQEHLWKFSSNEKDNVLLLERFKKLHPNKTKEYKELLKKCQQVNQINLKISDRREKMSYFINGKKVLNKTETIQSERPRRDITPSIKISSKSGAFHCKACKLNFSQERSLIRHKSKVHMVV